MHVNSIFYALVCLSAIVHTAGGSPVPPSSNRPAQGNPAPPNPSASHVSEPAGPVLTIGLPIHEPPRNGSRTVQHPPLQAPLSSRELATYIVHYIEAGLKFYAPRELGSFIPEFHTHPHCHIQFDYPLGNPEIHDPVPTSIDDTFLGTIQEVIYKFTFKPGLLSGTTTIDFWGSGVLNFGFARGHPFEPENTIMTLKIFEKVDGRRKVGSLSMLVADSDTG